MRFDTLTQNQTSYRGYFTMPSQKSHQELHLGGLLTANTGGTTIVIDLQEDCNDVIITENVDYPEPFLYLVVFAFRVSRCWPVFSHCEPRCSVTEMGVVVATKVGRILPSAPPARLLIFQSDKLPRYGNCHTAVIGYGTKNQVACSDSDANCCIATVE